MIAKKISTTTVNKEKYKDYWKKAENFFRGMNEASKDGNWDSTALEGIHSAILAADATLIYSKGYKSSSQRHLDVATLITTLSLDGAKQAARHLTKILDVKGVVEYSGDEYTEQDARDIVKQVERFRNWVARMLPTS